MDRFQLLRAVGTRGVHTTSAVADELGVTEPAADRALRDAERQGLVVEEWDESVHVAPTFNRQHWRLTEQGIAERDALEDDPSD